jgi:hypothetical protein
LFDEKDTQVGVPFMNYLRKNIAPNNLVEKDVVKAGRDIYGFLSGYMHGSELEVEIKEPDFTRNQIFVMGAIFYYFNRYFEFINEEGKTSQFPYSITK